MRRRQRPVEYRWGNDLTAGLYLTKWLNMDALSQTFSALADPTRRAILARLAAGGATVGELAEPFDMSLPAVSRHLRVLTDAGLIERHTEAQWRRCELRGEGLRAAADWMEFYRKFWEAQLDRLDAFLKRTAPAPAPSPAKGKRNVRRSR
jgi:DNA-binding transcriptional ArsR family regulator